MMIALQVFLMYCIRKSEKQKDNVLTAGKWTDEGLERYNNLLVNIREARQHRGNFEIELTGQYVLNEPRDVYLNKQHKRKNDSNNGQSIKKKKYR